MISNASCWYSWCHISPDLCYAICHCYFYNGSILASVCNMWSMSVGMFIWLLVSISMHSAFLKWLSRLSKAHNDSKRSMHIFSWHDNLLILDSFPYPGHMLPSKSQTQCIGMNVTTSQDSQRFWKFNQNI